jgi:hypothetical protein
VSRTKPLRLATRRLLPAFFATLFVFTLAAQLLPLAITDAGQVTTRSITLSTSATSAQSTYTLTFTPATTEANASIAIDFCSDTPLPGATCAFVAGSTVPAITATPTSTNAGSVVVVGAHTLALDTITGGLTAGTAKTFVINATPGATFLNPSTAGSYYARIVTYSTAVGASSGSTTGYVPAATTGAATQLGSLAIDTGGVALSTTANIAVTSKVFETLAFCVFQTACGTAPNLTLGDPTTQALSTASAYDNNSAEYTLATNASSGVGISMTGTTLCRSVGANCLTGASQYTINAIGNTAAAKSVGSEQFGMCADTTGSASLNAAGPYTDPINNCHSLGSAGIYAGTSQFGFNDSASNGTNNAAGSQIMSSSGAVTSVTGSFAFLGDVAATTEAGIYTTSLNMVATGTF